MIDACGEDLCSAGLFPCVSDHPPEPRSTASTPVDGFHSLTPADETTATLSVELPDWLTGVLIRNGPGAFELGGSRVDHWFDGLAMLTRIGFDGPADRVTFRNRFLRTDAFESAREGTFSGGFATGETTLRERLWGMLFAEPYDNTNVIAEQVGETHLAMTETPRQTTFDPATLATTGDVQYDGPVSSGQITCAHVHRDPDTDTAYTFDTRFGRHNTYELYAIHAPDDREHVASVRTDQPSYMHSFAMTDNYVVLTEFPYVVNPLEFIKPGKQGPFVENFRWEPDRGTRFRVIDRATGEQVAAPTTEPFFGFHHANAYEAGETVVLDLETVPDAESIATLSLDRLRAGELDVFGGRLDRFRLDPTAADPTVERRRLYDGTALPTVSPARRCRNHRYVYAQRTAQPVTTWPTGLVKIDTERESAQTFDAGADHFSEPIFVPNPDGSRPDDGVVCAIGLDTTAEASELVVLDGVSFTERARVRLPVALPFDFHGRFFPEMAP